MPIDHISALGKLKEENDWNYKRWQDSALRYTKEREQRMHLQAEVKRLTAVVDANLKVIDELGRRCK